MKNSKSFKLTMALGAVIAGFSTNAFAVTLQDVADAITIDGMLRYRYTDDKFKNWGYYAGSKASSIAKHQYRAEINFGANIMDIVNAKIGLLYHNYDGRVGANVGTFGRGLGSGADQSFGVSIYQLGVNLAKTNITFGKQKMQTPYNDIIHDRAVGILVTSKDIENWTLRAAWFDSWSVDDMAIGYMEGLNSRSESRQSINKSLFLLNGSGAWKLDESQNLSFDIWGTYIKNLLNLGIYSQLRYDFNFAYISAIYSYAMLDNNAKSVLYQLYNGTNGVSGYNQQDYQYSGYTARSFSTNNKFEKNNDLFIVELGARFHDFSVPISLRLGYFGNFLDNYNVSLDNEGYYMYDPVGRIWFENPATKTTISFLPDIGTETPHHNESNKLNMLFAKPLWDIIDTLSFGVEYVYGTNKLKRTASTEKITFQEITPILTFRPIKPFRITAYYAMLHTKSNLQSVKEDKNRFRLEVRYNF